MLDINFSYCCKLALVTSALASVAFSEVKLPAVLSDHAVLKSSPTTHIWGQAAPDETVNVAMAGASAQTKAGADGRWQVSLNLEKVGPGPFELTIKGTNEIKIRDVLIGEVWLASGQSNMDFSLKIALDADKEIATSTNPQVRFFKIGNVCSPEPKITTNGCWVLAGPATVGNFSAVAWYFAKNLQKAINLPVGIIQSSWGGSSVEAWVSPESLKREPEFKVGSEKIWQQNTISTAQTDVFKREFPLWLKATGREDHPSADASLFAAPDLDTRDWVPVNISASITGPGLPNTGAIWLRSEFQVPANAAGKRAVLQGNLNAIEKIYLNGRLVQEKKIEDYIGPVGMYNEISGENLRPGRNVIALRLYAPMVVPTFSGSPLVIDKIKLADHWIAKAEYALPDLADQPSGPAYPSPAPAQNQIPGFLFNGMIYPFLPATLSGFIWCQGETNTGRAWQYRTGFSLLIKDWRAAFAQNDLPFYYVQLANFLDKTTLPVESDWAELRDAQSFALKLPNTGQAVALDVGESEDIHYLDKAPIGQRLVALALARTYGKKEVVASGPIYTGQEIEGGRIRLNFTEIAAGLVAQPLPASYLINRLRNETAPLVRNNPQSELEGFQICGVDRQWVWADAKIERSTVLVSSPNVAAPIAVRYGWAANPNVNLSNTAGIPASPFRTDDFPYNTINNKL